MRQEVRQLLTPQYVILHRASQESRGCAGALGVLASRGTGEQPGKHSSTGACSRAAGSTPEPLDPSGVCLHHPSSSWAAAANSCTRGAQDSGASNPSVNLGFYH